MTHKSFPTVIAVLAFYYLDTQQRWCSLLRGILVVSIGSALRYPGNPTTFAWGFHAGGI
ncbi:MAG: hypothetical protein KatS3mg110_4490 [Pirellulaceae bacterium]|nr:MAG: hypothetical protein KatS3mg110_4490 [Pirellulaceae bacterium]